MTTYCNFINFPQIAKDILTNDINLVNILDKISPRLIPPDQFPKEFTEWLENFVGLTVEASELFCLRPYGTYNIHSDGNEYPNQKAKLNFVIGGKGSKMLWYEPQCLETFTSNRAARLIDYENGNHGGYVAVKPEEVKEVHSAELIDFCIVDAGAFHTVKNADEVRIAWSLVLADCNTKKRLNFPELQKRLSEYVVG